MNHLESIKNLLSPRKNKILTYAQMALPRSQFEAFRKLFLDEFGKNGLESDLEKYFKPTDNLEWHGTGRKIPRKEGGVP